MGKRRTEINPAYQSLENFIRDIPEMFERDGMLIYQARNTLKAYDIEGCSVIVKRFKKPHIINRLAYTFFRPSKARRSYNYAFRLLEKGIDTPAPIAYVEDYENGLLGYSYYISIYKSDFDHIRSYMYGEEKNDELLTELVRFISLLHAKGVYFLDMSPGNILQKKTDGKYLFSLVDINRMRFKSALTEKERYENFKRLSYNPEVVTYLAKEYAKVNNLEVVKVMEGIKKASADFFNVNL